MATAEVCRESQGTPSSTLERTLVRAIAWTGAATWVAQFLSWGYNDLCRPHTFAWRLRAVRDGHGLPWPGFARERLRHRFCGIFASRVGRERGCRTQHDLRNRRLLVFRGLMRVCPVAGSVLCIEHSAAGRNRYESGLLDRFLQGHSRVPATAAAALQTSRTRRRAQGDASSDRHHGCGGGRHALLESGYWIPRRDGGGNDHYTGLPAAPFRLAQSARFAARAHTQPGSACHANRLVPTFKLRLPHSRPSAR